MVQNGGTSEKLLPRSAATLGLGAILGERYLAILGQAFD